MRKQVWKKGLTRILCIALLFTNVLSTGVQAFAAETDMSVVDNKLEEEKTKSGTEGTDNEETLEVVKGEQEEKDSVGENTEDGGEEQEDADFENANDGEKDDTENEVDDLETEQAEENTDVVEDEEKDKVENLESGEDIENQTELMAADDDIASGISNDIVWVIDKNGKLTVTGTGDWKGTSSPWYSAGYSQYILSAEVNVKNITDTSNMFAYCRNLTYVDIDGLDTTDVTDMSGMFEECSSLKSIDNIISTLNTANVTDMWRMFYRCSSLTDVDISDLNTKNVTDMCAMFSECSNLTTINLKGLDTGNVITMSEMFSRCNNLISVDISGLDTKNVDSMGGMFSGCSSLTSVNLKGLDTKNVIVMRSMFYDCNNLKEIDLSSFDTSNVIYAEGMFSWCGSLTTIYAPYNLGISVSLPVMSNDVWYLSDGTEVTELPQNLDYSVVVKNNKIPTEEPTKKILITFDANGGTVNAKTMETNAEGKITEFPKAELAGTMFGGWYTESVFGDRVSIDTVFEEDTTLYARYFTENEIQYKDDMAYFPNSVSYYLTNADKENYYSNLDRSSLYRIRNTYERNMKNKTNGVCYGISSLMVENKIGKFDPSLYGANCFNELNPDDNIDFTSILTIYQLSQEENAIKNEQNRFAKLSLSEKLKEIIERAEEVSTEGPSIFCFRFGSFLNYSAHAIVIDGIEYGDVKVGGNIYYYTIKTYDINSHEGRPEYVLLPNGTFGKVYKSSPDYSYIYISKDLDAWTMKNIEYFDGEKQSGLKGKNELIAVYNSNKIFVSYSNWEKVELDSMLFINEAMGCTYTLDIKGTETVITNGVTMEDIDTGVYTVGEIATGENAFSSATVFLPDNYEGTILKKEGNNDISIMYASGYDLVNVESAKANELRFGQSVDTMQILGNEGHYHFDLIKENMSVNEINIDGQTEGDISIQYKSGGFLLNSTGENLVSVFVNGNEQTLYKNISEQEIFIKDVDNMIKIFIDRDNDGVYETEWKGDNDTEEYQTGSNASNMTGTYARWQISNRTDISEGIGVSVDIETWKPTTPDEKKRYACMGQEPIQYTLAKDNAYRLIIENAMQGPLCFDSFESVLGDYTIGRTYNIYPYPDKVYSMDEEVQFTIKIPEAIYKPDRTYKMICVTQNGLPIIYDDLDKDPETITVRTNKFYAYALIYK